MSPYDRTWRQERRPLEYDPEVLHPEPTGRALVWPTVLATLLGTAALLYVLAQIGRGWLS